MLIRISQNSEGIEHYFESGQKLGREKSRDELDQRVPLSGDLDVFSKAVAYTNKTKKWKNHYWHISGSFSPEDQNIGLEQIQEIHREILGYYLGADNVDKLIHAGETHQPKIQMEKSQIQRLVHFHTAISKLDTETGKQLRMKIYNKEADQAFQSYLALKYKLEDPRLHKRENGNFTLEEWVERHGGDKKDLEGKITLPNYKKYLADRFSQIKSLDDAKEILNWMQKAGEIESFSLERFPKAKDADGNYKHPVKNRYFKIQPAHFKTGKTKRGLNLRGKDFEALERVYYSYEENFERIMAGAYVPDQTPKHWSEYATDVERNRAAAEQKAIWQKHKSWWDKVEAERINKIKNPKPQRNFRALEERLLKKFEPDFKKRIKKQPRPRKKEQRKFYVIYRQNIEVQIIKDFRLWENNNIRYLRNDITGVKIWDRPDKVCFELPDNDDEIKRAVALGLKIAQAKGWDLAKIEATGKNQTFIDETKNQIKELLASRELDNIKKPKLNSIDYVQAQGRDREIAKLNKDRINEIKTRLEPQAILDFANKKWGLQTQFFEVKKNKKGEYVLVDTRLTKGGGRNAIDLLTKTCNQRISDVLPLLDDLLTKQDAETKVTVHKEAKRQADAQRHAEQQAQLKRDTIRAKLNPTRVSTFAYHQKWIKGGYMSDGNELYHIESDKRWGVVEFLKEEIGIPDPWPILEKLMEEQERKVPMPQAGNTIPKIDIPDSPQEEPKKVSSDQPKQGPAPAGSQDDDSGLRM